MSEAIDSFTGTFRYLSNFAYTPLWYDGLHFLSAEAAYQAAKCANLEDRLGFCFLSPREAKIQGQKIQIRKDWDDVKLAIMKEIVKVKFNTYSVFGLALKETYPLELIENNNWGDTYWGVSFGEGENHLGKILMEIRYELLSEGRL